MLKTIFVVFFWFSDKNNKLVFWAENQQKTKKKQFSVVFMSDMTRANGFLSLCQGQPELVPTQLGTN